jgi:MFS family permease
VLFLTTLSFFAVVVFAPLFLQVVTGASATRSGLLLLALLLSGTVSTALAGRLMTRTGRYKPFPVVGLGVMAVGLLLLSTMDTHTSQVTAALFLAVVGLGFGLVSQILTVALQNAVDRRDIGIATASANLFRALGGAVGVAIFGAILASRLDVWLARELPAGAARIDASSLQASPESLRQLDPGVQAGVADALAHALHTVFLVGAPIAGLGLLVVLALEEIPLSRAGGAQQRPPQPSIRVAAQTPR